MLVQLEQNTMPPATSALETPAANALSATSIAKPQRRTFTPEEKAARREARISSSLTRAYQALAKHQEHYRDAGTGALLTKDDAIVAALAKSLRGQNPEVKKVVKVIVEGKPTGEDWKEFDKIVARLDGNRAKTYEEMEEERRRERVAEKLRVSAKVVGKMSGESATKEVVQTQPQQVSGTQAGGISVLPRWSAHTHTAWVRHHARSDSGTSSMAGLPQIAAEIIQNMTTMQTTTMATTSEVSLTLELPHLQSNHATNVARNESQEQTVKRSADGAKTSTVAKKQKLEAAAMCQVPLTVEQTKHQQNNFHDSHSFAADVATPLPHEIYLGQGKDRKQASDQLLASLRRGMEEAVAEDLARHEAEIEDLKDANQEEVRKAADRAVNIINLRNEHNAGRERWEKRKEEIRKKEAMRAEVASERRTRFLRDHAAALLELRKEVCGSMK